MSIKAKNPTIFYGWFVVAAGFAVTLTLGEGIFSFGVFFKSLESEFGWSRALVSSAYTALLIGYAISVLTTGRLADRYSPRPILLTAALLAGLGFSFCSQVQSIDQLRIFLFIAGLGAGATWSVPTSTVQRWFYKRKRAGLALGIVVSGVGVGVLIFAPLINHLILSYGWRNTFLVVGILSFIIIAISSLMIRRSPIDASTVSEGEGNMPKSVSTPSWTISKVVTTPFFAGIAFTIGVVILAFHTVSVHLVPHATDVGISPIASAAALGLMGGFSVPGRIISGFLSDRISWQRTLALSCFGMALSLLWLLFLDATWMLYCFVFFYGMFQGSRVPAQIGILGEFFGMRSLGELIGITSAIGQLVGAFAPYMAGFIFDTTGSYTVAFIIIMVLLLGAGFIATAMKPT